MGITELREKAEANVDEHWNETVIKDGSKFYGWFDYPRFSQRFIEKMQRLVDDDILTPQEYGSLDMESTRMAGGGADITSDACIQAARVSVREDCIKFEMKRLQKLEE